MGARNEEMFPSVDSEPVVVDGRPAWVRPEVRRLVAGSAEDQANGTPDAATNPS